MALGNGLGQMGVTLFFGLSGFLMAYLYCSKPLDLKSLSEYVVNRTTRVLPLYFFVVIFTFMLFLAFDLTLLGINSSRIFIENAALFRGSNILWTIPVEVHFYVIFVGLWLASMHKHFPKLVFAMGAGQISVFFILYLNELRYPDFIFSWLHVFLFGSILGFYYERINNALENSKLKFCLSAVAWFVLLLAIIAPPQVRRDLGFSTVASYLDPVSVGYPLALLACTLFLLGPFSLFNQSTLRWYGKISYSLYLLHIFAVFFVQELVSREMIPTYLGFPLVLVLATFGASVSFYGFERPAQRILRSYIDRDRLDSKRAASGA
tara:strand:- start:23123 stop:24085 length:963 start_codon:yes stop_codon:yes gene_type:complete